MDWKQGLAIGLGAAFAPYARTWLYLKPAKYVHDFLWRNIKNERARKILFKKI